MYIRFVVPNKDKNSLKQQGLFMACWELRDSGKFSDEEVNLHQNLRVWFNKYLPTPDKFNVSKNKKAKDIGISWYKDTAKEHIKKMRELVALLENHGISTKMIREEKVGYIVYEDEFQVTAVPFSDTEA